jgi:hypothetical protein
MVFGELETKTTSGLTRVCPLNPMGIWGSAVDFVWVGQRPGEPCNAQPASCIVMIH